MNRAMDCHVSDIWQYEAELQCSFPTELMLVQEHALFAFGSDDQLEAAIQNHFRTLSAIE